MTTSQPTFFVRGSYEISILPTCSGGAFLGSRL
jgi:hypothetical protein